MLKIDRLWTTQIATPIGAMIAIASEVDLYLLEFVERRGLSREIEKLAQSTQSIIIPRITPLLKQVEQELQHYFTSGFNTFTIPIGYQGSLFQKSVWAELQKIPFGYTRSYSDIAQAIGRPSACRAVAQANSMNQIAIIIPCHRVIHADGSLGGYAGGIERKAWLLQHEKDTIASQVRR